MRVYASILTLALVVLAPAAAYAYGGPGAGLSLLGALWGLVTALGLAFMFVITWPVRALLRKRRHAVATVRTERPSPRD